MHLFFDTMTYLHYRGLDELDLTDVLGPFPHTVLFPRVTLRELDQHKSLHKIPRTQARARRSLRRIEEWIDSGEIRDGLAAEYYSAMPAVDYGAMGLDSAWADDVLIATVLQYRDDHPDDHVILVTDDTGVRLKAAQLDLDVRALPEAWRLSPEPDPVEVENRDLNRQLEALQNALPKLVVSIRVGETASQHASFTIESPPVLNEAAVAAKLEELRAKHPKRYPPQPADAGTTSSALKAMTAFGAMAGISDAEYDRYNQGVNDYLRDYEAYVKAAWIATLVHRRTISFHIEISNIGTSPADDVDVHLHFPDGFTLSSEGPEMPQVPRPPHPPQTAMEILQASMPYSSAMHFPSAIGRPTPVSAFSIKRTKSYDVDDHFLRIKHGGSVTMPEMFVLFDSFEDAKSFSCHYTVRPANLPEALSGDLHFVVTKGSEAES